MIIKFGLLRETPTANGCRKLLNVDCSEQIEMGEQAISNADYVRVWDEHTESMEALVRFLKNLAPEGMTLHGFQFGEMGDGYPRISHCGETAGWYIGKVNALFTYADQITVVDCETRPVSDVPEQLEASVAVLLAYNSLGICSQEDLADRDLVAEVSRLLTRRIDEICAEIGFEYADYGENLLIEAIDFDDGLVIVKVGFNVYEGHDDE